MFWDCKYRLFFSSSKIIFARRTPDVRLTHGRTHGPDAEPLFQEYEKHGEDQAEECNKMVPLQPLVLEKESNDDREYGKRYHFLYYLELHEVERPSVFFEAYPVGRDLCAVFEKCHTPTRISGHPDEIFISCSFRCPYQANVMNMLDVTNKRTVHNAFMSLSKFEKCEYFYKFAKICRILQLTYNL